MLFPIFRGLRSARTKICLSSLSPPKRLASSQPLQVSPIAGSLGAQITGVDLRESLDESTAKRIRQAFLDYKVIFFRDQNLSLAEYLTFSAQFGKPILYPMIPGVENYPEITHVLKQENETVNFGGVWHCDTLYLDQPPMGTMLLAREVPPYGGDTLFANQAAAFEALSPGLKQTLSTLHCINTSAKADASKTREDRIQSSGGAAPEELRSRHPAIRTHPETGVKSLYLSVAHTERFDGWTVEESKPLLDFLHQHQTRPEFTCRFNWDVGSIAFWDNRSALHNPINDYHGFRRSMHRITLAGDEPR